jgi:hypothetical protein
MTLTKLEAYVFGSNCAHFVTGFDFADGQITLTLRPMDESPLGVPSNVTAKFPNAVMTDTWEDTDERLVWPLDIIGFDSSPCGSRWKFVLNCDTVEWIWESEWPVLSPKPTQ